MSSCAPLTQACEDRDFVQWHQGCPWCAVWVLWPEDAALQALVQRARAGVADKLLPRYARQPHITVAYRGLMCDAAGHPAQEFGMPALQSDLRALAQTAPAALHVVVQGAHTFDTVPYLQVQGASAQHAQHLQALHQALSHGQHWPNWRYVPHITLGHYAGAWPQAQVLQALQQAVHGQAAQVLRCDKLWLVRYATHDVAGPLVPEGYWHLQRQCYVPHADGLLQPKVQQDVMRG